MFFNFILDFIIQDLNIMIVYKINMIEVESKRKLGTGEVLQFIFTLFYLQ